MNGQVMFVLTSLEYGFALGRRRLFTQKLLYVQARWVRGGGSGFVWVSSNARVCFWVTHLILRTFSESVLEFAVRAPLQHTVIGPGLTANAILSLRPSPRLIQTRIQILSLR